MRGDRLKALREARGMRQIDLAIRCGVHPQAISDLERGASRSRQPRLGLVIDIADALGTSLDYLTGRSDKDGPAP